MAKIISVLACGRSGTSLTSQTLMKSGVQIGSHTKVTYENLDVRKINDKFLADNYGANINSLDFYGALPNYEILIPSSKKQEMRELVSSFKGSKSDFFAFKDPRVVILHDGWVNEVDVLISVYRNPIEVCASLMKMFTQHINNDNRKQAKQRMIDYWIRFNKSLIHVYEKYNKPNYIVKFDETYNEQMRKVFTEVGIGNYEEVYKSTSVRNNSAEIPADCKEIWDILEDIKTFK